MYRPRGPTFSTTATWPSGPMPGAPPFHSATAPTDGTWFTTTPCSAAAEAHWPALPSRYRGRRARNTRAST